MAHVNCSVSLCFNTYRKKNKKSAVGGQERTIEFYPLPHVEKDIQLQYQKILKTLGFNWKKGFICSEHYSLLQCFGLHDKQKPRGNLTLGKDRCVLLV